MAARLEILAEEFERNGCSEGANILRSQVPVARELGIPDDFDTREGRMRELRESHSMLIDTVWEYNNNPSPESMTKFNQAFWREACRVEGEGREIVVPNLSETVEVGVDVVAPFDPREVSLVDLGKMFPKMKSLVAQAEVNIIDTNNNFGYFLAKMTVDAPYLNATEEEWIKNLNKGGLQPMSLKHYIIFGQMMYALKGKYPDQGRTWSRLDSDSCYDHEGRALSACFVSDGDLYVLPPLDVLLRYPLALGGRGEKEVIKA